MGNIHSTNARPFCRFSRQSFPGLHFSLHFSLYWIFAKRVTLSLQELYTLLELQIYPIEFSYYIYLI